MTHHFESFLVIQHFQDSTTVSIPSLRHRRWSGKQTPPPMHQGRCLGWTLKDTPKEAKLHGRQCPLCASFRLSFLGFTLTHPNGTVSFTNSYYLNMIGEARGGTQIDEEQLRSLGRNSSGVRGINIDDDDEVIGAISCDPSAEDAALRTILVVSENGFGKRTDVQEYRKTARGAKGVRTINITEKTGPLVAIKSVTEENDLMIINKSGLTIRMSVKDIRVAGRATQGVKLINIREGDAIAAVCPVAGAEDAPEEMSEETTVE